MLLSNLWFYVKENRVQVLLSSLSMAIAVLCMHLISSMSYILKQELMHQVSMMGTDLLLVYVSEGDIDCLDDLKRLDIIEDYSFMRNELDIKYVEPSYFSMFNMNCSDGRLFSIYDENVVVLGKDVKGYRVGDLYKYNHQLYRVVGILDEVSESFYGDDNGCVFLPYVEASGYQLLIESSYVDKVDQCLSWVVDDYELLSQVQIKESMSVLFDLLQKVMLVIAGISFVVCIVGIMNVSLLNVNSRFSEIGVCKAIGASDWQVFMQFILEVMVVGVVGYVVGSVSSVVLLLVLCLIFGCAFYMSLSMFVILLVVCLLVSSLSGLVVAFYACHRDVVEVLSL